MPGSECLGAVGGRRPRLRTAPLRWQTASVSRSSRVRGPTCSRRARAGRDITLARTSSWARRPWRPGGTGRRSASRPKSPRAAAGRPIRTWMRARGRSARRPQWVSSLEQPPESVCGFRQQAGVDQGEGAFPDGPTTIAGSCAQARSATARACAAGGRPSEQPGAVGEGVDVGRPAVVDGPGEGVGGVGVPPEALRPGRAPAPGENPCRGVGSAGEGVVEVGQRFPALPPSRWWRRPRRARLSASGSAAAMHSSTSTRASAARSRRSSTVPRVARAPACPGSAVTAASRSATASAGRPACSSAPPRWRGRSSLRVGGIGGERTGVVGGGFFG